MLASLILHEPFTLQYSREQVSPENWQTPQFRRSNYLLTGVWVAALALMAAADGVAIWTTEISVTTAAAAGLVGLAGALIFTLRYPVTARRDGAPD
jgi:hypothetical protein